jgi:hypothetical protein
VIVLFLHQYLRSDNDAHTILVRIVTVIVNQFDLLHHGCHIVVTLLAVMCRWLKYRRVLSPFLE